MLEITSQEIDDDVLQRSNKEYNFLPDSEFLCMDLLLSFGDISNLDNLDHRKALDQLIEIKSFISKLFDGIEHHDKIRIWASNLTTEDKLSMMFALHLIKSKNKQVEISLIDPSNLSVHEKYPDTPSWQLACIEDDRIAQLLNFEEKLSEQRIDLILNEWNKIVKDNSSLRICEKGVIRSVDEDYFDSLMLDVMKDLSKAYRSKLIGTCMAECMHLDGNLTDLFFVYRLDKLIEAGKIKVVKLEKIFYHSIVALA